MAGPVVAAAPMASRGQRAGTALAHYAGSKGLYRLLRPYSLPFEHLVPMRPVSGSGAPGPWVLKGGRLTGAIALESPAGYTFGAVAVRIRIDGMGMTRKINEVVPRIPSDATTLVQIDLDWPTHGIRQPEERVSVHVETTPLFDRWLRYLHARPVMDVKVDTRTA